MKPLFSAAIDYLALQRLEGQFKRVIGRCASLQARNPHRPRDLNEADRSVVERACEAGLVGRLKPGVVDSVVSTPELAHALIAHGAQPTEAFLTGISNTSSKRLLVSLSFMANAVKHAPHSPEAWLVRLVELTAGRHPQLDWFQPEKEPLANHKDLLAFGCRFHFPNLLPLLFEARHNTHIPLAPSHVDRDGLDRLLDEALSPYENLGGLDWTQKQAWTQGLLARGADPDRRMQRESHEPPLCALARALRRNLQFAQIVLEHGARLDEQALLDIVFVMHDRQHPMRANKNEIVAWFEHLLDRSGITLDLEAIVPSCDYHQPSLERVLKNHYPDLLEALLWRRQATRLEHDTATVAPVRAAPGRRL